MFSNDGLSGAMLLGHQLEIYRWEDHFQRARDMNALAANDAAWRNEYNELLNRYNRLEHDANRLADIQDRLVSGQAEQIAELKATNASLAAEVEKLRLEVLSVRGLLNLKRMVEEERTQKEQQKGV